jgi:hypothetical protein
MKNRNRRTVFLGLCATLTFVWAAIYQFDVPAQELAWLLAYCVAGVLLIALLAALGVGLVLASRYLWRRISREPQSDSASAE